MLKTVRYGFLPLSPSRCDGRCRTLAARTEVRGFLRCAWAALASALLATVAQAHPGHSGNDLQLNIAVTDQEIRADLFAFGGLLGERVPIGARRITLNPLTKQFIFKDADDRERTVSGLANFFHKRCPVRVDGVVVKPIVRDLRLLQSGQPAGGGTPQAFPPDVALTLVYPLKGRPQQVAFVWSLFLQDTTRQMMGEDPAIPLFAELDAYDEQRIVKFTPHEPEHIWHAPTAAAAADRVEPVVVAAEPQTIELPLASATLAAVGLLGGAVAWFGRRRKPMWLTGAGVTAGCWIGAGALGAQTVTIESPWAAPPPLPDEAAAREVFAALHRNVYRAFDYKRESDIYDVLAQSVSGDLLDRIYNEVYQSLILRDEGGAVARVHEVDVLDANLLEAGRLQTENETPALAFKLEAQWRVVGVVQHWGHAHQRTNEYLARYTVAQQGEQWKITDVQTLAQQRIVMPGDDPEPPTGGAPPPNPMIERRSTGPDEPFPTPTADESPQ